MDGRSPLDSHAPSHGTREILLLFGSLLSSDPGDIHKTISSLVSAHITCTVIGLAAQVAICRTLVERTNPSTPSDEKYAVVLNEPHYRDLLMRATIPPATHAAQAKSDAAKASLLMMGFPSRMVEASPTLCACHSRPNRGGYLCARCSSKVCALPTTCPVCSLTLILSTHLARSYHHLFPLRNWIEVSWSKAHASDQHACFGCQTPFPERKLMRNSPEPHTGKASPRTALGGRNAKKPLVVSATKDGVSESGRYECENCGRFFCIDCDVFCHEIIHNCPGCQSREQYLTDRAGEIGRAMGGMQVNGDADEVNGVSGAGMEI